MLGKFIERAFGSSLIILVSATLIAGCSESTPTPDLSQSTPTPDLSQSTPTPDLRLKDFPVPYQLDDLGTEEIWTDNLCGWGQSIRSYGEVVSLKQFETGETEDRIYFYLVKVTDDALFPTLAEQSRDCEPFVEKPDDISGRTTTTTSLVGSPSVGDNSFRVRRAVDREKGKAIGAQSFTIHHVFAQRGDYVFVVFGEDEAAVAKYARIAASR